MGPDRLPFPPIFIIGPPRSGTTLVYQTIVNAFEVGYLTNLHALLHGGAGIVDSIVSRRLRTRPSEYVSEHGNVDGASAPSEAGAFWYRWFSRSDVEGTTNPRDPESLRRVVAQMIVRRNQPVVFKNVYNSLRIRSLASIFPEARFIVVQRSPVMTAQSILLARKRVHGTMEKWWSVRPPGIPDLSARSPEEQAVLQVCGLDASIRRESEAVGMDRFFPLRYEQFCRDTHGTLDRLDRWLVAGGVTTLRRWRVPASFSPSEEIRLPAAQFAALEQAARMHCVRADVGVAESPSGEGTAGPAVSPA